MKYQNISIEKASQMFFGENGDVKWEMTIDQNTLQAIFKMVDLSNKNRIVKKAMSIWSLPLAEGEDELYMYLQSIYEELYDLIDVSRKSGENEVPKM